MSNNMIYFHSPNLTHGKCPNCENTFDAKEAKLAFPGNVKGKCISFVFALCPECNEVFASGDNSKQKEIIKTTYINLLNYPHDEWTVTTSLALSANAGDFFDAWWYGVDLPKVVFDAINDGLVDEIVFLPSLANFEGFDHA